MTKNFREAQAAEILGKPVRTLQQWRWKGVGPKFLKLGRSVLYTESDLQEFLDACRVETKPVGRAA